jgi:hypothetical protein
MKPILTNFFSAEKTVGESINNKPTKIRSTAINKLSNFFISSSFLFGKTLENFLQKITHEWKNLLLKFSPP